MKRHSFLFQKMGLKILSATNEYSIANLEVRYPAPAFGVAYVTIDTVALNPVIGQSAPPLRRREFPV